MPNRILNAFGTLRVVGWRSAFWYAVYRAQLASGVSRRRTPIETWESAAGRLPPEATEWDPDKRPAFLFDDARTIGGAVGEIVPRVESDAANELEQIRQGAFRLWEDGRRNSGFPPVWNRNPLTGRDADAGRHWTATDEESTGEIKGLWELSRFGFAFRLARLYAVTGDERAPEIFWQLLESWLEANPPNAGPQWLSAQEAALRAMAWIFALHAFRRAPATTSSRAERLIAALGMHARRIEATLAYAKAQNNNHLISEACGLFTIGLLFPRLPKSARWRSLGRSLLESTAGQFFSDGGYIQHSMNYHRLALQLYLWAMRLAEVHGRPFSSTMYAGVDRSLGLLSRLVDRQSGRMPNFGHNDGALFLALSGCAFEDYRPLLQTLSLWRKGARIWIAGLWDEDALWLLGPDSVECAARLSAEETADTEKDLSAPRAGLFTLHGRQSHAIIRCARFRERPAHADQLHMDLWWRGENIACDAGSYLYNGDPPWRNALTRTEVHNTVTIDGVDQMTPSGRFGWATQAQGRGGFIDEGKWRGAHDGYNRIGVLHTRTVERLEKNLWIATDEIAGIGSHTARLQWMIPDYPWEQFEPKPATELQKTLVERLPGWKNGSGCGWRFHSPVGEFSLQIWSNLDALWTLYQAGVLVSGLMEEKKPVTSETRGWRSLRYASKMPALSLAGLTVGILPIRFASVWTLFTT